MPSGTILIIDLNISFIICFFSPTEQQQILASGAHLSMTVDVLKLPQHAFNHVGLADEA